MARCRFPFPLAAPPCGSYPRLPARSRFIAVLKAPGQRFAPASLPCSWRQHLRVAVACAATGGAPHAASSASPAAAPRGRSQRATGARRTDARRPIESSGAASQYSKRCGRPTVWPAELQTEARRFSMLACGLGIQHDVRPLPARGPSLQSTIGRHLRLARRGGRGRAGCGPATSAVFTGPFARTECPGPMAAGRGAGCRRPYRCGRSRAPCPCLPAKRSANHAAKQRGGRLRVGRVAPDFRRAGSAGTLDDACGAPRSLTTSRPRPRGRRPRQRRKRRRRAAPSGRSLHAGAAG